MTNIEMVKKLGESQKFVEKAYLYAHDRNWESIQKLNEYFRANPDGKITRLYEEAFKAGDEGRYPLIEKYLKSAIENLTEVLDEIQKPNITIMTTLGGIELCVDPYRPVGRILFDNGFAINTEKVTVNGNLVTKDDIRKPLNKHIGYDCDRDMNYIQIHVCTKNT